MEGYIVNNSGKPYFIFKRKFPMGHRLYLADLWKAYQKKVCAALEKEEVAEPAFVKWLEENNYMKDGFVYHEGSAEVSAPGDVIAATSAEVKETGASADGRLVKPSLEHAPRGIIEKLTYREVADLRVCDNPRKLVSEITNLSKLRRAYTIVRSAARKRHLEKVLRERIQDLERL